MNSVTTRLCVTELYMTDRRPSTEKATTFFNKSVKQNSNRISQQRMSECNHITSIITSQHCHGNYYHCTIGTVTANHTKKGKGFPYSIPSVGPGADPGVQAVSLQVTVSHPPGGRLPLLSARPAVTSPAAEHHCPLAGTKLYCLVTEAHRCKQLA